MELRKIRNPLHFFLTNKSSFKPKLSAGVKQKQFTAPMSSFIPVHLADSPIPALSEEKIEIRFPDGIQVVLTEPASLTVAESLISRR